PSFFHDPGHMKLPMPLLVVSADRAAGTWNFQGNLMNPDVQKQPSIQIAPDVAAVMAGLITSTGHISREVRKDTTGDARPAFVVHGPGWDPEQTQVLEFELNAQGMLEEVRCVNHKRGLQVRVHGIVIGDPLPASAFAVQVPAGAPVHAVQQINPM